MVEHRSRRHDQSADDTRFDRTGHHLRQLRVRYGWAGLVAVIDQGQITRVIDVADILDAAADT